MPFILSPRGADRDKHEWKTVKDNWVKWRKEPKEKNYHTVQRGTYFLLKSYKIQVALSSKQPTVGQFKLTVRRLRKRTSADL